MRRFGVATTSGWVIGPTPNARRGGDRPCGLSAHVIDRAHNCRVVAVYRSEDRLPAYQGGTRGAEGAMLAARDHARYLEEHYG